MYSLICLMLYQVYTLNLDESAFPFSESIAIYCLVSKTRVLHKRHTRRLQEVLQIILQDCICGEILQYEQLNFKQRSDIHGLFSNRIIKITS